VNDRVSSFLTTTARIFGLFAGLAVLVYLVGGAILFARLALYGFARLDVVTQLPREFLISIGLVAVLLPFLVTAAIYMALRLSSGFDSLPPSTTRRRKTLGLLFALIVASAAIAWGIFYRSDLSTGFWGTLVGAAAIILLVGGASAVTLTLRAWLARQYPTARSWNRLRPALSMAALLGIASVPLGMVAAVAFVPLDSAKVCTGGDQVLGRFLGESSDRVYLGEFKVGGNAVGRVAAIPSSEVKRIYISHTKRKAEDANCVLLPPKGQPTAKGQADMGATGPSGPTVPAAVRTYAPLVLLHPRERFWPMDPEFFIRNSELKWAAGKCRSDTLAVTGAVNEKKLGGGDYLDRVKSAGRLCRHTGPQYASNKRTRPHDNVDILPRKYRAQGFALDLDGRDNSPEVLEGDRPAAEDSYPNPPILYFNYRGPNAGRSGYVRYWLFYGYNSPDQRVARIVDRHEGDWEGIAVRLDPASRATEVAYFQHNCGPETYSWPRMRENGYLSQGTHPVAFVANGSHATYPEAPTGGTVKYPCKGERQNPYPAWDRVSGAGPRWEAWRYGLADAEQKPWYGFGGAWGRAGAFKFTTGPLGPSQKHGLVPDPWQSGG
jgi:hypothetical protein